VGNPGGGWHDLSYRNQGLVNPQKEFIMSHVYEEPEAIIPSHPGMILSDWIEGKSK
jgi:hypothetical protein